MKTTLKRLSLAVLISLAVVQIPFIYRRAAYSKLAEKIHQLKQESAAKKQQPHEGYSEHRGVFHVHTSLGGHSTGSFAELISAAHANDLDFVVLTEHWSDEVDTAGLTLNGRYGKTLFVAGNEIETATVEDRLLMVPGRPENGLRELDTAGITQKLRAENRSVFVTYPEKFTSWNSEFDGIEVFSLHTNAQQASRLTAFLDILWSYASYPDQVLMNYFARPDSNLQKFDEIASSRRISLIAGADAHSNIGFHLFGDDAGHKLVGFKLDDYSTIFRLMRQHVLLTSDQIMDQENLLSSLKAGHSFIGFDALADTTGFRFGSADGRMIMGDEIELGTARTYGLISRSPSPARFVVYRNGEVYFQSETTDHIAVTPNEPGAYRVEVYLDQLGPPFDKMPWIISNPVFVRAGL